MAWFGRKSQEPVVEEIPEEPRLPEPPALNASGMRSVVDHTDYLLSLVTPLEPFGTSLLEAWDQVMCEDIDSSINVPPNSTAKVAGYAVRAADLMDDEGHLAEPLQIVEADVERLPEAGAVVVAAGDVARWPSHRVGALLRIEHWDNAIGMGEQPAHKRWLSFPVAQGADRGLPHAADTDRPVGVRSA